MYSVNIFRVAVLSLVCVLANVAVRAQSAAAVGGPSTKIGIINMLQAISSTAEGKQAGAELQSQFAPRQQELESLNKQINDLQQRLNGGPTLSEEERARLNAQGTRLAQRLDRKRNEYQEDLNTAQGEIVNILGRKMMEVLDRYAQENSYVAVFDSSAQNTPILYASKNIDLTQDIIRLYDQSYPVKGASAAPLNKPAPAGKSAPPPSPKPQ